jgi:serine/threonine-protein kinase RsbW
MAAAPAGRGGKSDSAVAAFPFPLISDRRTQLTMTESVWTWTLEREIPSCSLQGHRLILEIIEQLQQLEWSQRDVFGVHLALEEAVVNAIKHGNNEDPEKKVTVLCKLSPRRCWVLVEDEGPGFNPAAVPDCTLDENLDKPSGRGLKLMKNFMTMIEYNDCGNRVVMEKVLTDG